MIDRRGRCLLDLGEFLLVAGAGLGLAFGCSMAVAWCIRPVMAARPPWADLLVAGFVLLTFLLWAPFSVAAGWAVSSLRRRREAARRRRFEGRHAITDEEFARLLPGAAPIAVAGVRAELERFIGRREVSRRLAPGDPVRATCELAGFAPDDLDWVEFLRGLEALSGGRLPDDAYAEASVADLVEGCAKWGTSHP